MTKKVFLGGTCNNSQWRKVLIPLLTLDYFDPLLPTNVEWTENHQKEEIRQRESADFVLYVLTPRMTGVYSIAEVVDDSNKRPEKTILCILDNYEGFAFAPDIKKSLLALERLIQQNNATVLYDLKTVASFLNNQ